MIKPIVIYPFTCKKCNITVNKTKIGKSSHHKNLCRASCDGIQRDLGGWFLDPKLRQQQIQEVKRRKKLNKTTKVVKKRERLIKKQEKKYQKLLSLRINWDKGSFFNTQTFYQSKEWQTIRVLALEKYGRRCHLCGNKPPNVILHVDHIIPISVNLDKRLDIDNLQILCELCNRGKSNHSTKNYRKPY